jgi:signal transduction histidine kinase
VSARVAVPILAILAIPVIAAAALLVAFDHEFVSEDLEGSRGQVIEGSIWIVTGLIAWWRVPGNRIGPLSTAFGFVDIAGQLYWDAALPFTLAPVITSFLFAIGVHLFLAFPSGRLQTRSERALVGFVYGATVVLAPAGAMFRQTRPGCPDCPANLLFVADIPALADTIDTTATVLIAGVLAITIALVIRHWRAASPESRLALEPVLAVSGLATLLLIATVVAQGLSLDGAVTVLNVVGGTLFVLIPIAFLAGLLRLRLHRAREADLEVERLQAQLRAQLVEVRASRARIVEVGNAERRRLERDLHDGAQQRLLGVRLALRTARMRLADGSTDSVDELLAEADAEVMDALAELRDLAHGIQPAVLTEEGIGPALAALARRTPVPVQLEVSAGRLPPAVEATAYFVAAESLANIVKHADASWARVSVVTGGGRVLVAVDDDGRGGADPDGAGLRGLRDRVEAVDGRFRVESPAGGGTHVSASISCA